MKVTSHTVTITAKYFRVQDTRPHNQKKEEGQQSKLAFLIWFNFASFFF